MVWNQRGKKGVHCGRTVRRNVTTSSRSWYDKNIGLNKKGLIVKYQKNAERLSRSLKESILDDRYGLVDGLTLAPNVHFTDVEFSLGKRKRWLLPELVQQRVSFDCEEELEEDEDEQDLSVCFVERLIHSEIHKTRGDCVSFFSDKDGKVLTPKKHKCSFQTDMRHLSKDERPSEVCYEICRPPSPTSWPNMKEGQFVMEDYDKMGQIKSKGHKSKGLRWGVYEARDLSINKSKEICREVPKHGCLKKIESKIKTVNNKQFSKIVKDMDNSKKGKSVARLMFPMGQYIDTLLKQNESAKDVKREISSCVPSCSVKKYGKGCAVLIDSELCTKTDKTAMSFVHPDPSLSLEEPKCQVAVDVALQDFDVSTLKSEWGDAYSEGGVFPRKLTFDITKLLPGNNLGVSCFVLLEVDERSSNGETSIKTNVSLVPVTLCSDISDYNNAPQDFVSILAETKMSAPFRIKEIVNTAMEVFLLASDAVKNPLEQTERQKAAVKSLSFLNEICGWKSESYSLDGAKQQLKGEFQKEARECSNEDMALDPHWMMLSIECEICFETFEGGDMLTSLKECGHAFCSDCWKGHLKTQINQGIHSIRCPGQSCESPVDNTIIMSLVPLLYEKFINMKLSKQLETSPNWKWCPATGCKKVVKATSINHEAVTVLCDCGMTWCFKCQQPSHWPATCKESETFDKLGKNHKEALLQEEELITSVMVKHCPQCDYPIEKFHGCQFMVCILCSTHFCWNCCTPAKYGHSCDKVETDDLAKVDLSIRNRRHRFEKFLNVVVKSIQARDLKQLSAKGLKAKALETGVSSYKSFPSKIPKESNISRLMEYILERGVSATLREALEFEFQAHLVLEGSAKKAAVLKSSQSRSGLMAMSQLAFVVDRIDLLCQEPFSLCKDGNIQRLEKLLAIGKDCISALRKRCKVTN